MQERGGEGECYHRRCCVEKSLDGCWQCEEFPCDNGFFADAAWRGLNIGCTQAIKEQGAEAFVTMVTAKLGEIVEYGEYRFRTPEEVRAMLVDDRLASRGRESGMGPTSPEGRPIAVRPIERAELDRVVLRCWPERDVLERLFEEQGTIGMVAWEGEKCVGTLHCYRIAPPDWGSESWPEWNQWWTGPRSSSETEIRTYLKQVSGPMWCHACCHVGRTLELQSVGDEPDHRYFGRGIGTALCRESVSWAREHGYAGVLAPSAAEGLFRHAVWSGSLPWTTYARLGFRALCQKEEGAGLPAWAQGDSPPEVMAEVRAALAAGRAAHTFHGRPMVLDLRRDR